jgi:RNA polymerase sigma factor (sigma-70 family)
MTTGPSSQQFPDDDREKSLAEGLTRGDPRSVREFLETTHRPVYHMTARLTQDPDLRHDWTHEVLLAIVDELGRGKFEYRWPGCFWSWFQKRSYFMLINFYRRQKTISGRLTTGELGEDIIERMSLPQATDPSGLVEGVEARTVIEECLAKIKNEDHRDALSQALFQEASYQHVADTLSSSLNTVRSWIRRARTSVRECVAARYSFLKSERD